MLTSVLLDDDIDDLCKVALEAGVDDITIRRIWNKPISEWSDEVCVIVRDVILRNSLKVSLLFGEQQNLSRQLHLCQFFSCPYLGVELSRPVRKRDRNYSEQLYDVTSLANGYGVTPVIVPGKDVVESDELAPLLHGGSCSLMLSPKQMLAWNRDPYSTYWCSLKDRVTHILAEDATHDGPCLPGMGMGKLDLILDESRRSSKTRWYCISPGSLRDQKRVEVGNLYEHQFE